MKTYTEAEMIKIKDDAITACAANCALSAASHAQSGSEAAADIIRDYGLAKKHSRSVTRLLGAEQANKLRSILKL
jgi:hypothetical protein